MLKFEEILQCLLAISTTYQQSKYTRSIWSGNGVHSHCSTNFTFWAHIHTVSGHQTLILQEYWDITLNEFDHSSPFNAED